ncbi:MAG: PepSY-associated TM helix domain-containing protein [Verrucomicrobia bacterium]|nr:PepSY-associated TM helix domain-containing protein [Verrucomicrobiota bacterium]
MVAALPALQPAQRIRRWHTYLVVWKLHRWLGLACAALLLLLSVTGSLLVAHHELERLVEPDRHLAPAASASLSAPRPALSDLARTVAPLAPAGYRLFRLHPAADATATHQFIFLGPDRTTRWSAFVAPATGAVVWSGPDQSLLAPWLLGLHMQLHAGLAGYFVTGFAGLALIALGVSGLYLYRDRLTALRRHPFRLRLGWRVALADLHKWTGVAALYFVIVLGLTGTLYVCSILTAKPAPAPATAFAPAKLAPLEPILAAAQSRLPGTELLRIQFPAQPTAALTLLLLHRDAPVWEKFSRLDFDPATGVLRTARIGAEASPSEKFAAMLAPLHFGFYGAPWVKWAYVIGGLSPALLSLTGFFLWRQRNKHSGPASGPGA